MKNKLIALLVLTLMIINTFVYADGITILEEKAQLKSAIALESLGIVNDYTKWNDVNYISRRDFFDMIYRILKHYNDNFDGTFEAYYNDYSYGESIEDTYKEIEKTISGMKTLEQELFDGQSMYGALTRDFIDIDKNSENFLYWYAWTHSCILSGKIDENGNYYADLDGYLTNYEAIKTICNMLSLSYDSVSAADYYDQLYEDYFQFAEDVGLINHKTPIEDSCTHISRDELNEKISAYECMNLVYYALYIPTFNKHGVYDVNYRLIERYYFRPSIDEEKIEFSIEKNKSQLDGSIVLTD